MEIIRDTSGQATKLSMRKPSDMHQHLRQGVMLKMVAPMVAKRFAQAIIMPNTVPPITTAQQLDRYRAEIMQAFYPDVAAMPYEQSVCQCLMTLYLTDTLDPQEVELCVPENAVGVKYYPRGLTTNSDSGVADPKSLWTTDTRPYAVLRVLAESNGVLLLHAADGVDQNGGELDPYDQEKHFIRETLPRIIDAHPDLKISIEHISTKDGVEFISKNGSDLLGCSITAHHLLLDRRDMFRGGFRPHCMWWPIIQPQEHAEAIRWLVQQGYSYVWLGSDSAPHPIRKKETSCCVGGVLMAHAGIELYVEAFDNMNSLNSDFEAFASIRGPLFYGMAPSDEQITLVREPWKVRESFYLAFDADDPTSLDKVVPFRLGEEIHWKLVD